MVTQAGVFGYARQTSSRATQRMQHAHDGRGPQEARSWQPARETEPCMGLREDTNLRILKKKMHASSNYQNKPNNVLHQAPPYPHLVRLLPETHLSNKLSESCDLWNPTFARGQTTHVHKLKSIQESNGTHICLTNRQEAGASGGGVKFLRRLLSLSGGLNPSRPPLVTLSPRQPNAPPFPRW